MDKPHKTSVSGIDLITVTRKNATQTIMLLHGFGAGFEDLAPLESYLDPHKAFNWIFPDGILDVSIGPHTAGKAWFPIRMAEIEAAAMKGETFDFADLLPEGMKAAEERILTLIQNLHLLPSRLVLGGFSQGAMMTLQVASRFLEPLQGLVLFSGTLINQIEWKKGLVSQASTPFFQSHGKRDPILGYLHAQRLNSTLLDLGFKGQFISFDGHHEIPMPVVRAASEFLTGLNGK